MPAPKVAVSMDPALLAEMDGLVARYSGPKKLDHDFESNPW
jgi:hypothetical protein